MLALILLMYPALHLQCIPLDDGTFARRLFDFTIFALATLSAGVFYGASQYELTGDWRFVLKFMPMMMAIGVGLCVSNTKAILEALLGKKSEFVRTPKYGDTRNVAALVKAAGPSKRPKRDLLPYVEFLFGLYVSYCSIAALQDLQSALASPFLAIFAFGFFYVSIMSFQGQRAARTSAEATAGVKA
jgi:hypothetical protein